MQTQMSTTVDPIAAALAAALAQQQKSAANLPAVSQGHASTMMPGKRLSMDDLQTNMVVDKYLKVDVRGLLIEKVAFDTIRVQIDLSEVQALKAIKWNVGQTTNYSRSYDAMTEANSGKPWGSVVEQARNADAKCKGDYPSAEVPMTLLEDLIDQKAKDKAIVAEAGMTIGYTPSTTGFKHLKKMFDEAKAKYGPDAIIEAELGFEIKFNPSAPNGYALVTFKLIEAEASA